MAPRPEFPKPVVEEKREVVVHFRVTEAERDRLTEGATAAGSSDFSTWGRWAALTSCDVDDAPPEPAEEEGAARGLVMRFRVNEEERGRIEAKAAHHELSLSEFARRACLDALF